VDLKTFEPQYVVSKKRGKGSSSPNCENSPRPRTRLSGNRLDREGEAIAWHLKEALGVSDAKARRVIFKRHHQG